MTRKHRDLLAYIQHYRAINGESPTQREMANFMDTSSGGIGEFLLRLRAEGHIRINKGATRGVVVLKPLPNEIVARIMEARK